MYCPECGDENPNSAEFCGKCGNKLVKPFITKKNKHDPYKFFIIVGILFLVAGIFYFVTQFTIESVVLILIVLV